jgi:glycosyltransferase involved in cell wall biosynthesis
MSPTLSVCICTYNRAESLRSTLTSLATQTGIESESIEIIVVDNNCTDITQEVVEDFRKKLPVRRLTENKQGLSHARNRAVGEFRGDVLLFTDDDVRLESGWLNAYQDAIRRFPSAGYFGGRILPDWGQTRPKWIGHRPLPLLDGLLGWFDEGVETRVFRPTDPLPFGASFAIKRSLFEKVRLFRVDLGTGGSGLGRGEETELLMRARDAGAHGVYVGKAVCFHSYDPRRLKIVELYRYGVLCGRSHDAIVGRTNRGSYRAAAWFVLRGLYQVVKGRGDRFCQCIINAGMEVGTTPDYGSRRGLRKLALSNRFERRV